MTRTRVDWRFLMEFPREMKKGSQGPHVTVLQSFLCGAISGRSTAGQLVYDEEFGDITEQLVNEFQVKHELTVSGNWDMQTRGAARRVHAFNYEEACMGIPGTTVFVQSDGSKIHWGREREAREKSVS